MQLRNVFLLCLALCPALAQADPSVAFYYGYPVPSARLQAFNWVVVDPDALPRPRQSTPSTQWFAYISVGEAEPYRSYFSAFPKSWLKGENADWGSYVIDQTAPGWPDFFLNRIVEPLWQAGYRGFFLDTLDSWQLIARNRYEGQRQQDGLANVIRRLKQRHPEAKLIFNRGFEILPALHPLVTAVAAESLFQSWNPGSRRYEPVSPGDREWLLYHLNVAKYTYGKPVISIDYVPPTQPAKQLDTARRIQALGFIPWVSVPSLDIIGVGLQPAATALSGPAPR